MNVFIPLYYDKIVYLFCIITFLVISGAMGLNGSSSRKWARTKETWLHRFHTCFKPDRPASLQELRADRGEAYICHRGDGRMRSRKER